RKLPLPSYCNVAYSYWPPASVSEVCAAAFASGYRIWPPPVPLTFTVRLFPWSVANPIDHPDGSDVVGGSVTVSPAPVLKLDTTLPLSPSCAAYPLVDGNSQFPGQSRLSRPFVASVLR